MSIQHFTTRQLAYIDARVAGHNKKESAMHAGYSPAGADRQATQLEKLPKVKRAIAAGKRKVSMTNDHMEAMVGGRPGRKSNDDAPRMKPKYESSLDLLRHTYNNPRMPDSVRLRAAEQALPYEHARVGEKGKKESARERAKEVAGSGVQKSRFGTKAPPPLRAITGGKT